MMMMINWITQFYLQITPCLLFLRKRSPDSATPDKVFQRIMSNPHHIRTSFCLPVTAMTTTCYLGYMILV